MLSSESGCQYVWNKFDCSDQEWFEVPDIDANATIVDLSRNSLDLLRQNTFSHLQKCKQIYLDGIQIFEIEHGTFRGMEKLWELRLAKNKLTSLKAEMFAGIPNVETFSLACNQLAELDANVFVKLPKLRKLYLNGNKLTEIPSNMWQGINRGQIPFTLQFVPSCVAVPLLVVPAKVQTKECVPYNPFSINVNTHCT